MKLVCPELHEHILRESNHIFVEQKLATREPATALTHKLNDAIRPLLIENGLLPLGKHGHEWLGNLTVLFEGAMNFKAKVLLRAQDTRFYWPIFNDEIDPTLMTPEKDVPLIQGSRVLMTVFPALVENTSAEEGINEEVLIHGIILQQ